MNPSDEDVEVEVSAIVALIEQQRPHEARQALSQAQARFPARLKLCYLDAVLCVDQGEPERGRQRLWQALALAPDAGVVREHLLGTLAAGLDDPALAGKDFSLHSGERQVAETLAQIRRDHRVRYEFAARHLLRQLSRPWTCLGLDAFSGNGYGSRIVADVCGARMLGLDGSDEATELAERAYGSHQVVFGALRYPFVLQEGAFDFAISFESVEHVDDPEGLLEQISQACRGPLYLSVPNEAALPFAVFGGQFQHHRRHFTRTDILQLLARVGRTQLLAEHGQDVYRLEHGRLAALLSEDRMGLHPLRPDSQFLILALGAAS